MIDQLAGTVGLLLLAAAGGAAPLPEAMLLERWELSAEQRGSTRAFFARSADGTHLYKPDASVRSFQGELVARHGNFEGELLSTRLIQEVGLTTPQTDVVRVPKRGLRRLVPSSSRFLRSRLLDEAALSTDHLVRGVDALPREAILEMGELRRLQLTDLLIGNVDRNGRNLWFLRDAASGRYRPVAIDHNLALGDPRLSPAGRYGAAFSTPLASGDMVADPARMHPLVKRILTRNDLYRGALWDPRAVEAYRAEAGRIRAALGDARLAALVGEIPDQAFGWRRPERRRRQLLETLRARRDALGDVVEAIFRTAPAPAPGHDYTGDGRVGKVAYTRDGWGGNPWDPAGARLRNPAGHRPAPLVASSPVEAAPGGRVAVLGMPSWEDLPGDAASHRPPAPSVDPPPRPRRVIRVRPGHDPSPTRFRYHPRLRLRGMR